MTELRVIDGDGEDAGPPLCTKGRSTRRPCFHKRVQLDVEARKVICAECEAVRDPFDALLLLTDELERYYGWRDRYKAEAQLAADELADLKRQVRNAKAQLARWKARP
jgi:hypothetical protein